MATIQLTDTRVLAILEAPKIRRQFIALQSAYPSRYVMVDAGCCGQKVQEINSKVMNSVRLAIGGMSQIELQTLKRLCNMQPSDTWVFSANVGAGIPRKFQA